MKANVIRKWQFLQIALALAIAVALWEAPGNAIANQDQWSTVTITDIDTALKNASCRNSEYASAIPDTQGHPITSLDVIFTPSTVMFRGQPRPVITIQQVAKVSAEWIRGEFRSAADAKIPKESCDDISHSDFGFSVPNDGTLVIDFDIYYQANTCTDGFCYRGWHHAWWGGYPEFGRCSWKTQVPGGSAILGVHTVMTPQLTSVNGIPVVQIKVVPHTWVKQGPSELMKNIVGALTLGIGSKAIQDEFEHQVGDFKASLTPEVRTVAFLKLPDARKQNPVVFKPDQPSFQGPSQEIFFVTGQTATAQPGPAKEVRTKAIEARKFFESCVRPQTEYAVANGDNLWRIAENLYGEGQFYHVLANLNPRSGRQGAVLRKGAILKVAPYYQLVGSNEVLVKYGDTLWQISKQKLGDPLLYPRLLAQNNGTINDPRKLTTLIPIKIDGH